MGIAHDKNQAPQPDPTQVGAGASDSAANGSLASNAKEERPILPAAVDYLPGANPYVLEHLDTLLKEHREAKQLRTLAQSGDDEAFDAEVARRAQEAHTAYQEEQEALNPTKKANSGEFAHLSDEDIEAARARSEADQEKRLLEKVKDKYSGWSFFDPTERLQFEDLAKEAKIVGTDVAEKAKVVVDGVDNLTGNIASKFVNRHMEALDGVLKGDPEPFARRNYADIQLAHTRWQLKQFVKTLKSFDPFGGNGRELGVELQKFATAATVLQWIGGDKWNDIEPDFRQFVEVTKKLGRQFFQEIGYEVPLNMNGFSDEKLAVEFGILEQLSEAGSAEMSQARVLDETNGALKLDVVMGYYDVMRKLWSARKILEIKVADGASSEEAKKEFSSMWQKIGKISEDLPEWTEQSVMRALVFGANEHERLVEPAGAASFQLIAEQAQRSENSGFSVEKIASVSADISTAMPDWYRKAIGEEGMQQLEALWNAQTVSRLYEKPAKDMSDAELQAAIEDVQENEKATFEQAQGLFDTMKDSLAGYDGLVTSFAGFPPGGAHEQTQADIAGSVAREESADGGIDSKELRPSERFEQALAQHTKLKLSLERILRDQLKADPTQILKFLEHYQQMNQSDPQLATHAEMNARMFQSNYQIIVPQLGALETPKSAQSTTVPGVNANPQPQE